MSRDLLRGWSGLRKAFEVRLMEQCDLHGTGIGVSRDVWCFWSSLRKAFEVRLMEQCDLHGAGSGVSRDLPHGWLDLRWALVGTNLTYERSERV